MHQPEVTAARRRPSLPGKRVAGKMVWRVWAGFLLLAAGFFGAEGQNLLTVTAARAQTSSHQAGLKAFLNLDAKTRVRFFESPRTAPPYGQRLYRQTFPPDRTRFVWWELYLEFPETEAEAKFPITAKWYDSTGRLIRTQEVQANINSGWEWAAFAQGFGNDSPGVWLPGVYRVVLEVQNYKVTEASFTISGATGAAPPEELTPQIPLTLESLRLFESGKEPPPMDRRKYLQRFTAADTRYIRWQLNLEHPGPRDRRTDIPLTALWYGPDGKVFKTQTMQSFVAPEWDNSYHGNGIGSQVPGAFWKNMPPGNYQLVIKTGNKVLATESFELEGDAPAASLAPGEIFPGLKADVAYLRFYEGGRDVVPEDQITFARQFPAAQLRFIKWELGLVHPGERPHRLQLPLTQEWYGPDGKLLASHSFTSAIEASWNSSRHTGRYGGDIPGEGWSPGTYRVVVKLDGKELSQGSFEVVSDPGAVSEKKPFLESIGVQVVGLRFFPGDREPPPLGSRTYTKIFPTAATSYIFWELNLSQNGMGKRISFTMEDTWHGPDDKVLDRGNDSFFTLPTSETFSRAGYGFKNLGRWKPGTYRVVLKIQGQEVAQASFEVVGAGQEL